MEALEEKLGYRFTNRSFLENALTHSSYANENTAKGLQSNERLAPLGDMSHIIHIEAPSSVCFCLTISPMLTRRGSDPHPGGPGV